MVDRRKNFPMAGWLSRLEMLVEEHTGGNWRKFSIKAGIREQTISSLKRGAIPGADLIRQICVTYNASADFLLLGQTGNKVTQDFPDKHHATDLGLGDRLDPGYLAMRMRNIGQKLDIEYENLSVASVNGDEMSPVLAPGTVVLIDRNHGISHGIFCLRKGDTKSFFRRISASNIGEDYTLSCENIVYAQETISEKDLEKLFVGKVVWSENYF